MICVDRYIFTFVIWSEYVVVCDSRKQVELFVKAYDSDRFEARFFERRCLYSTIC